MIVIADKRKFKRSMSIVLLCMAFCLVTTNIIRAKGEVIYSESYSTYEIQSGDTLWSIASANKHPEQSTWQVVSNIKELNNLHNSIIYEGCQLLIPTN